MKTSARPGRRWYADIESRWNYFGVAGHLFSTKPSQKGAAFGDEDLGSAGPAMVRRYRVILVYGKDGIGYPIKMDNMGKTIPADFANAAANYAKLAQPPIWYSY